MGRWWERTTSLWWLRIKTKHKGANDEKMMGVYSGEHGSWSLHWGLPGATAPAALLENLSICPTSHQLLFPSTANLTVVFPSSPLYALCCSKYPSYQLADDKRGEAEWWRQRRGTVGPIPTITAMNHCLHPSRPTCLPQQSLLLPVSDPLCLVAVSQCARLTTCPIPEFLPWFYIQSISSSCPKLWIFFVWP